MHLKPNYDTNTKPEPIFGNPCTLPKPYYPLENAPNNKMFHPNPVMMHLKNICFMNTIPELSDL